ncbi:7154_t:CDS:2, partial [Paraglomus occultum]
MSRLFDQPAKNWTYDAIVANYCIDDNVGRALNGIKQDLQQRAERGDCDAAQAKKILTSGWQLGYCVSPSDGRVPLPKVPKGSTRILSDILTMYYIDISFRLNKQLVKAVKTHSNISQIRFDKLMSNNEAGTVLKRKAVNIDDSYFRSSTPSPVLQPSSPTPSKMTNIFSDEDDESDVFISDTKFAFDCPIIINDVIGLNLGPSPRKESRWFISGMNVSEKWHLFKKKSLELANRDGLFVESHTQQILSLSHILLLKPKQHCPLMVEVFSAELLEIMHKDILQKLTKQETEFDDEILMKLVRIVKRLQRKEITRDNAVSELQILAVGRSYGE